MRRINRIFKILSRLKLAQKRSFFLGFNHIFLLLISTFFLSVAMGINIVSMPLVLYKNGVATSAIGLTTASDVFSGIIIIYFLHKFGKRIGIFNSVFLFGSIAAITVLILPFYQNFALWFLLSFVLSATILSISTLQTAWVNIEVKSKIRSMIIATNNTVICFGLTIGPIIIKFLGAGSYKVFIISAICTLMSALILIPIRKAEPKLLVHKALHLIIFIKHNPKIVIARFLIALQCETIMFFTVIYGIKNGISAENSGLLVSIFCAIGIFDVLIGFLVNQKSYQRLITLGFAAFLMIILILPSGIKNFYFASLIYIILGWLTSLITICNWYGVNLKRPKNQLISINSLFIAIGLFGGFLGNFLAGILMQWFDKEGFVIIIAINSLVYLLIHLFFFL